MEPVGRVLGTEDATPLSSGSAVAPGQLPAARRRGGDPAAAARTGERSAIAGVVTQVRARHEGARFDSDVFAIAEGMLPAEVQEAAEVQATRVEPEVYVPPAARRRGRAGPPATRATSALSFDRMDRRLPDRHWPATASRSTSTPTSSTAPGARTSPSPASPGVATKTSFATFLLYSVFRSGVLGGEAVNTKALIFNVKGEDLLFLDHPNTRLDDDAARPRTGTLGLRGRRRSRSVGGAAPRPRRGDPTGTPTWPAG